MAQKKFGNIDVDAIPVIAKLINTGDIVPARRVRGKSSPEADESKAKGSRTARTSSAVAVKFDQNLTKLRERAEQSLARSRASVENRVLQEELPFWSDENRGVPNPFIRSGIFSVGRSDKERKYVDKKQIPSLSNYEIRYSGKELHQDDLDVWMSLINMAASRRIADSIFFTGYELLKDLGWTKNSRSYDRAKGSIERLKVTGLEITLRDGNEEKTYSGSLIREYMFTATDEAGATKWMVRFEPNISMLFLNDTTTLLEWQTRKKLGSKASLAKWLHGFYSSHFEPIPYRVEKIKEMSGSTDSLSSFRATLKSNLEKLKDPKVGFLTDYQIIKDMVHVVIAKEHAILKKAAAARRLN